MIFCMNCGTKIVQGDKFCRECGANLRAAQRDMQETMQKSKEAEEAAGADGTKTATTTTGLVGFGLMNPFMSDIGGRYFSYDTHGMMFRSGYTLKIFEKNGKLTAMYRKPFVDEKNARTFEVDDEFFERITAIIDKNNGDSWDGFSGHAQGVMDGDSFSFSFNDGKGKDISAGGYMAWPNGLGAAIAEIRLMFDMIYDELFPDLGKIMREYIENEVAAKYEGNLRNVKTGDILTKFPYLYGDMDGYYKWGENLIDDGVLGYQILGGYEGRDPKKPGVRAVVLVCEKEKAENSNYVHAALKVRYYGLEPGEDVRLIESFKIKTDMVVGDYGKCKMFNFGTFESTTIGFYCETKWKDTDKLVEYVFDTFRLEKDEMKLINEAVKLVKRDEEKLDEEAIQLFCKNAEEAGLGSLAIEWGNECRRTGHLSSWSMGSFFGYWWTCSRHGDLLPNPDGKLANTPIEGWDITVFRE